METAARQLQSKLEAARALLERGSSLVDENDILDGGKIIAPPPQEALCAVAAVSCARAARALAALEVKLALATGPLFVGAAVGGAARAAALAEYTRVLGAEAFSENIDALIAQVETPLRDCGALPGRAAPGLPAGARPAAARRPRGRCPTRAAAELTRLFAVYPRGALEFAPPRIGANYDCCLVCGGETATDAARSELRCRDPECGAVRELVGTVFDDSQFYSQEGQKAKSGTFNPNRHFQFWWSHILAREPEEEICDSESESAQLLDALRAIIERDRKVLRLLTVNDVRAMLRELGQTELNKNVPLLMKKLTGVGPPQVPDSLAVRVENLFTKAITIGERVRRPGRVNRNYYPYYIYRIVEALTEPTDFEIRRMLYYIYIQSKDTVDADDADWELICAELGEIEYRPTDRSLGEQYRPL